MNELVRLEQLTAQRLPRSVIAERMGRGWNWVRVKQHQLGIWKEVRPKRKTWTPEQKAEIARLHVQEGLSFTAIGKRYGVSRNSISQVIRTWKKQVAHALAP